jgi:hypothetical protein
MASPLACKVARMIKRLFHRGVALNLGSDEIQARSTERLRASLATRQVVAPARLAELGVMSDRALEAQASALDALSAQLASELSAGTTAPARILAQVQEQDTPLPGTWTEVLGNARGWSAGSNDFQRVVLESLVEYLGCERACVRILITNRDRDSLANTGDDGTTRQRLILDPASLAQSDIPPLTFSRLAKGDPTEVLMAPGQALELKLAHQRFLLVSGVPWLLVDDVGEDLRLQPGHTLVGRSSDCEAMVHESYVSISRRHMALDIRGTASVIITDLSSLGTFLPKAYLECQPH